MKIDWEFIEQHPKEEAIDWLCLALPLCGCGSGDDFELILDVLRWSAVNSDDKERHREPYLQSGCYCSIAHEMAAKILNHVGLVEHGTGIGWPWITEDGKKLLAKIDGFEAAK